MGEREARDKLTGPAAALAIGCTVLLCGWVAWPGEKDASLGPMPAWSRDSQPNPRVVPVHVVPADLEFEHRHLELNSAALEDVRQWYARSLGGPTFQYDPIVVQRSRHTLAELSADDFQAWWPLLIEEFEEYGLTWNTRSDVKLLMLVQGAGGWAGGDSENGGIESIDLAGETTHGEYGGVVLIGDSSVAAIARGACPVNGIESGTVWWCNWNTYRGTIAHELGHAWGVPHPDAFLTEQPDGARRRWDCGRDGNTVMQCHWNFPHDSLLTYEARHLRSLRFFRFSADRQYLLLSELPPISAVGRVDLYRLDVTAATDRKVAGVEGRGGGAGYPWAVVVGDGTVQWQLQAGCWTLVADVGRSRGAGGYGTIQVMVDGTERAFMNVGGGPPVELRAQVCGPGILELKSAGERRFTATFGNARIYRER